MSTTDGESAEIESLEKALASEDWTARQSTAQQIGALDANPHYLKLLRERESIEGDPDVRAAITGAIAQHEGDANRRKRYLLDQLSSDMASVRLAAALSLARDEVINVQELLKPVWRACAREEQQAVQAALCQVLGKAPEELVRIADRAFASSASYTELRGAYLLRQKTDWPARERVTTALACAGRLTAIKDAHQFDVQGLYWASDKNGYVRDFLEQPDIAPVRATAIVMAAEDADVGFKADPHMIVKFSSGLAKLEEISQPAAVQLNPFTFQEDLVEEATGQTTWVEADPQGWLDRGVRWVTERRDQIDAQGREQVIPSLLLVANQIEGAGSLVISMVGVRELLKRADSIAGQTLGRLLVEAELDGYNEVREMADDAAPYVIKLLGDREFPSSRFQATSWLGMRSRDLAQGTVERALEALRRVAENDDEYQEIKNGAKAAIIELEDVRRKESLRPLIEKMRVGDEEKALQALETLDQLQSFDAARAMVEQWVVWIPVRERTSLVEAAAERLRRKPNAVLPILEHLLAPSTLTKDVEAQIRRELVEPEIENLLANLDERSLERPAKARLEAWLTELSAGSDTAAAVSAGTATRETIEACVRREIAGVYPDRVRQVRRRLARHLSEMSEARFFVDLESAHPPVLNQLRVHAVSMLGRTLTNEEDVEVRESIARTLATLGGPESVDALARAVSGEERTSRRRQDLLARYYLDPSREQSDQAAKLLNEAVSAAKRTLRVLQILNFLFFMVGLGALSAGLWILLTSTDPQTQFTGGAISAAAFLGLVVQITREPLDRIQDAMNKLVQVETAFSSFIWELNLNSTYIQSQYVARGVLQDDEVAATVHRIENAMRLSMDLVTTYAGDGMPRARPELSSVSPAVVEPGTVVRLSGAWLGPAAKGSSGHDVVLINHRPSEMRPSRWSDSEIIAQLPDRIDTNAAMTGAGEVVWLSVVVGGRESNAVPIHVRSPTP